MPATERATRLEDKGSRFKAYSTMFGNPSPSGSADGPLTAALVNCCEVNFVRSHCAQGVRVVA